MAEPGQIRVFVNHIAKLSRVFTVDIDASATVNDLSEKIVDQRGIPIHMQTLCIPDGRQLERTRKLADCGIANESSLVLFVKNWMPPPLEEVKVRLVSTGETLAFEMDTHGVETMPAAVGDLKRALAGQLRVPSGLLRLTHRSVALNDDAASLERLFKHEPFEDISASRRVDLEIVMPKKAVAGGASSGAAAGGSGAAAGGGGAATAGADPAAAEPLPAVGRLLFQRSMTPGNE